MRVASAAALAIALTLGSGAAFAGLDAALFGLHWGQSAEDTLEMADAKALHWSIHQRYGQSFEVDRLPIAVGGEINRTLYFDDENRLLRVWVNFGNPGGEVWEKNYRLDAAIEKYKALKAAYESAQSSATCTEPPLNRVEHDGRKLLAASFAPNQNVWFCSYRDESTELTLSLRRLGDRQGERFDVILDAQDPRAVMAYRAKHPLRGRGHGALTRAEELEEESVEIDCKTAESTDRSTMDTSPFALLYRRICHYETTDVEEEEMRRFDEVILLD